MRLLCFSWNNLKKSKKYQTKESHPISDSLIHSSTPCNCVMCQRRRISLGPKEAPADNNLPKMGLKTSAKITKFDISSPIITSKGSNSISGIPIRSLQNLSYPVQAAAAANSSTPITGKIKSLDSPAVFPDQNNTKLLIRYSSLPNVSITKEEKDDNFKKFTKLVQNLWITASKDDTWREPERIKSLSEPRLARNHEFRIAVRPRHSGKFK